MCTAWSTTINGSQPQVYNIVAWSQSYTTIENCAALMVMYCIHNAISFIITNKQVAGLKLQNLIWNKIIAPNIYNNENDDKKDNIAYINECDKQCIHT